MKHALLRFVVSITFFAGGISALLATNLPPEISIIQPTNSSVYLPVANIAITADAFDLDGTVARVEFFEGTNKLNETSFAPYTFTWLAVPAGIYSLTAVATDNEGATNTSAAISVIVNPPPAVSITSPTEDANFTVPNSIPITASATDNDSITNLEFFANGFKLGELTNSPLEFLWIGASTGLHELTARATDNYGVSRMSAPVLIFVTTTGGALAANNAVVTAGATVDLTAEGTNDWVHWGWVTAKSVNRKLGVAAQISNFTPIEAGPNEVFQLFDNYNGYSWTDGTPALSVTNTTTGLYVVGLNTGFQITVPASTNVQTLKLYVGSYGARGKFRAYLNDFTAPIVLDYSLDNAGNGPGLVYTVTYAAASPNRQLVVRFTTAETHTSDGNVTLQAATLSTGNLPPVVAMNTPTNNAGFQAPANIELTAAASDLDGSIAKVEFFQGNTKLGERTNSPYSLTWSNVAAGNYTLTAKATDNGGVTFTSPPIFTFVTNTGGFLSAIIAVTPSTVDLTSAGNLDWVHWGLEYPLPGNRTAFLNRKRNVPSLISTYTAIGVDDAAPFTDNLSGFSWTDGNPIINANQSTTGIYKMGLNEGFKITLPADTTLRRVKVYVGVYRAQGRFEATLSDFSAASYIDTSIVHFNHAVRVYTINYAAASAGKTLTIRHTVAAAFDEVEGNVTFQAAALANPAPMLTLTQPVPGAFGLSLPTEANLKYLIEFTDLLNPLAWQSLTNFTGDGTPASFVDPAAMQLQRYYRARMTR
jgi:hypothetical protein